MCFSATASFITAGATGAIGLVAMTRARSGAELPLAAMPALFAIQQAVEGLLWVTLPVAPASPGSTVLTSIFLLFADVLWPIYAPLAVLLIEPSPQRRRLILGCLLAGVAVALYLLIGPHTHPHTAVINGGHIVYDREAGPPALVVLPYLVATVLALALSSWPTMRMLAALIALGYATAYVLYWHAFISVWCFFAAAASVLILAHFERARAVEATEHGKI